MPAVSVVLPIRGDGEYLEDAIRSICNQSFADFEVIVVDNGLTPEGHDILRQAMAGDQRFRIIRQTGGLSRALDAGCRAARASLIARMDSDDIAQPDRFARQVAHMRSTPDCVACGTWVMLIDPAGCDIRLKKFPTSSEETRQLLRKWPCIAHASAMFRAQAYEAAGGYGIWYRAAEDYALWLRMAALGKIENLPFVGHKRRIHPHAVSVRLAERQVLSTLKIRAEARRVLHDGKPYARVHLRDASHVLGIGRRHFAYEATKRYLRDARSLEHAAEVEAAAAARRNALRWMGRGRAPGLWFGFALHYLRSFSGKP